MPLRKRQKRIKNAKNEELQTPSSSSMEERENRTPLLQKPSNRHTDLEQNEIVPFLSPHHEPEHELEPEQGFGPSISSSSSSSSAKSQNQRLVSLDVFRGLTIALMILVDDAGGAFPAINHSPWFGVTIADFVMPFFLFIVGVSIGVVFKKILSKSTATKKVLMRTIKLFLLGIFLQGGFIHGRKNLTYGVDILKIRWLGVLQRIAIGYLLASIAEIWLVNNVMVDSAFAFARRYYIQWLSTALLCIVYLCLLYGLYVPSWKYEQEMNTNLPSSAQVLGLDNVSLFVNASTRSTASPSLVVQCGVRGSLDPPCNAVGFIDRLLLGENHLYQRPVYRRVKQCSEKSPDYGPLPPNSPGWCLAPFDPEGLLSSLMAAVTCFVGLHFGHIIAHFKDNMQRMLFWSISSFTLIISGYVLLVLGMPLSKPLYTLSYTCITAGTSGFIFTIIFYLVDVKHIRKPMILLQWMGMNALILYALAACEIFPSFLQGFYWGTPENNLVDQTELFLQDVLHSKSWGTLAFVIIEVIFWCLVAGLLHMKRIYVKI